MILGSVIIVLALAQFVLNGWSTSTGNVLDLGMLSAGIEGRGRSALILIGLLILFILTALTFGLQYGAIILAAISPAALMIGKRPWAWGFLTGGIIAAIVFLFFNDVMSVIWPEPMLGSWLLRILF